MKHLVEVAISQTIDFEGKQMELTPSIIELATALRQTKKRTLGDAIIAATAIDNDLELWTANTDNFKHIEVLKLLKPLQKMGSDFS